jgi:hypothetical protein
MIFLCALLLSYFYCQRFAFELYFPMYVSVIIIVMSKKYVDECKKLQQKKDSNHIITKSSTNSELDGIF